MSHPIRSAALVAVLAVLSMATPAFAHHAWNEIDTTRTMTLTGTVKSLKWENPHASLVLAVAKGDAKGDWFVEMSGLSRMEARGVDPATIAVGKALVIVASPSRDGGRTVRANRIRSEGKDHVLY